MGNSQDILMYWREPNTLAHIIASKNKVYVSNNVEDIAEALQANIEKYRKRFSQIIESINKKRISLSGFIYTMDNSEKVLCLLVITDAYAGIIKLENEDNNFYIIKDYLEESLRYVLNNYAKNFEY